jgi:hypothetical protein
MSSAALATGRRRKLVYLQSASASIISDGLDDAALRMRCGRRSKRTLAAYRTPTVRANDAILLCARSRVC